MQPRKGAQANTLLNELLAVPCSADLRCKQTPRMIRYRLDDLGPYQFEKLMQSALKAIVGLGVESWGNRGDWGRDAYTPGSLRFPDPNQMTAGPFIFQAKFVEEANAAGSKPSAALVSSATKEVERILERKKRDTWLDPTHFTFVTNSPVEAKNREKIRAAFSKALPSASIHIWGGDDVCDILDRRSGVARAFPQLLSIRDLDELIKVALNAESRARSETALQLATELVAVFAPTSAYEHAWRVLRKHHFAVLEGPPEVGKSAIAWMIGLTQAAQGWETIVCRTPDVFFQTIESNQPQVFIADDAFGRTEYDPTRTSKWEADLDLVLHRLNPRHWLIWTSRKHILERACERMDAQGKARSFPDPGSVLVDVSELSIEERALILFRHCRSAALEKEAKALVRKNAGEIIEDPEFTPERIRRFVHEGLPAIVAGISSDRITVAQVKSAIKEALRNPTKQMRITFEKLLPAYKWLLVALLEVPDAEDSALIRVKGNVEQLHSLYDAYCPDADHEPFEIIMEHLTEAFVKVRKTDYGGRVVDWIHPSYRDLVIDELIQNADLRNTFLRRVSLEGVKLAVSDTGGRFGKRRLPFIRSAESWDVLEERCLSLISSDAGDREVLEILGNAAAQNTSPEHSSRWVRLLTSVCNAVRGKWDTESRVIGSADLEAFTKARKYSDPELTLPTLLPTWEYLDTQFKESLHRADSDRELDYDAFDNLTAFAHVVEQCAPEFLEQVGFPNKYEAGIASVLYKAQSEASERTYSSDPDELRALAERKDLIAASLERLDELSVSYASGASKLADRLRERSSELEQSAVENEPPEPDYDYERAARSGEAQTRAEVVIFDVAKLFSEL
jgi:hypothetical protein